MKYKFAAFCVISVFISACGHEQVRRVPVDKNGNVGAVARESANSRTVGERAAVVALRQIGVPYVYGGSTDQGFDCSGLVQYAYAGAGRRIPRTTSEQWRQLTPVKDREMRVGDLLFFRIGGSISHVGMYLGDRRFVHAPSSGRQVSVEVLDSDFYRRAFVRAARPY
ncbi:MAG: C40 family peptidase [Woeseiaceae bacterium]